MLKAIIKNAISVRVLTRLLDRCSKSGTVILTYHDIRHDNDPKSWLRVGESNFVDQICALKKIGTFISWKDLFKPSAGAGLRFLMTFDDGYRNNYELARPILEEQNIPTVFFVSTHHMLTGEPFWFDELVTPVQALQLTQLDLRDFGLCEYNFQPGDSSARWDEVNGMLEDIKHIKVW